MAISFLQDDIYLSNEQWNVFRNNLDSSEFEVEELGTFSFSGEGTPEFDDFDKRYGTMTYVVEDLDNEYVYLFKIRFSYSDHYDLYNSHENDQTLEAISKSDSLNY